MIIFMKCKDKIQYKEPKKQFISIDEIRPKLLFSHFFIGSEEYEEGTELPERVIYNYELEFFTSSKGQMHLNDEVFQIQYGDIVFRKPGDRTSARMPYECYGVFFDMTGASTHSNDDYFKSECVFQPLFTNEFLDQIPSNYNCSNHQGFMNHFRNIFLRYIHNEPYNQLITSGLLLELLFKIFEDTKHLPDETGQVNYTQLAKLEDVKKYIHEHIEESLSLNCLSEVAGFSEGHFRHIFKNTFGMSALDYVTSRRILYAKELLASSRLSLADIALNCGFQSQAYFCYVFKKQVGVPPLVFRKKHSFTSMI